MSTEPRHPLGPAGRNVRSNVRRLREDRRWSYREVADQTARAGHPIPVLELSGIDAGTRRVDVDELVALAAVFDVGPEQLLGPPADCENCHGAPPPGFICARCEAASLPAFTPAEPTA